MPLSTFSKVPSGLGEGDEYKPDVTGGMSFDELMREAVNIKGAQLSRGRKRFDAAPEYFQHTLFLGETDEEVKRVRQLPVSGDQETLFDAVGKIKAEGNALFQKKPKAKISDALECYKKALACIYYFKPTVKDWKTKGMQDDHMQLVDLSTGTGQSSKERSSIDEEAVQRLRGLKASILLNIAACFLKKKEWKTCVVACTDALEAVPSSVKALYRRALARIRNPSSGGVEFEQAMKDLRQAIRMDPSNREVRQELQKLRETLTSQKKSDKANFSGLFQRGQIYDGKSTKEEEEEGTAASMKDDGKSLEEKIAARNEENNRELQAATAQMMHWQREAASARAEGDEQRAAALMAKVDRVQTAIDEWSAKNEAAEKAAEARTKVNMKPDFLNPTAEMIADAKKQGIDLEDEQVRAFIKELEERKLRGEPIDDFTPSAAGEAEGASSTAAEAATGINMSIVWTVAIAMLVYRLWATGLAAQFLDFAFSGFSSISSSASSGFPMDDEENILADDWDDF